MEGRIYEIMCRLVARINKLEVTIRLNHISKKMKAILLLIALSNFHWILSQNDGIIAQNKFDSANLNCNCFTLDYSLVNYGTLLQGTVIKIKKNKFRVKINNTNKGKKKLKKNHRATIHFTNQSVLNNNDSYKLELNNEYLFILGNTKWKISTLILRNPYNRFIIKNDSLFIPYEVIDRIDFTKEIDIKQTNTFNDSLYLYGYKISLNDFLKLSEALNDSFNKIDGKIVRVENSKVYSDPFILSFMEYRNKFYK